MDTGWIRLVWETGGPTERRLLVAFMVGMALMPFPVVIVLFFLHDPLPSSGWYDLGAVIAIAGSSWTILYPTVGDGMHTARFYRMALERGRTIPLTDQEYVAAWATIKERLGINGQFPRGVGLAWLYLGVYMGTWWGSFAYVVLFYRILLEWTVPLIPLYALLWLYSRSRSKNLMREATLRGLPLAELYSRQIVSRRRARPPWYPPV